MGYPILLVDEVDAVTFLQHPHVLHPVFVIVSFSHKKPRKFFVQLSRFMSKHRLYIDVKDFQSGGFEPPSPQRDRPIFSQVR